MTENKNYWMFAIALLALIAAVAATPAYAQTYSVIYNFSDQGGPSNPFGSIVQGRDGNLYTTSSGGGPSPNDSIGTVFKITPAGELKVPYNFCFLTNCADGENPPGGLVLRPNGHFLGTTSLGGSNNAGTIFDISQTGTLTTLYNFTFGTANGGTNVPPILGPDGNYYGMTFAGGLPSNCGTVYRLTPVSGTSTATFTVLHKFNNANGCIAQAPLVLGTDGNLYGSTFAGGSADFGEIFQVVLRPRQATEVNVIYNFDGSNGVTLFTPSGLVQGQDGNFYGTAADGGTNNAGGIFKITPSGTLTVLHLLNGTTEGSGPLSGLVQATDGNFYGTTTSAGEVNVDCPDGCGTLFQITPAGAFTVLYTFDFFTGNVSVTTPFQHTNGLLYGDTAVGGICGGVGCGVFYSWDSGLPAFVRTVPFLAPVGTFVEILGQGFDSSTTVRFNGTPATATVVSGTYLNASVPAGATTGFVTVTTSSGTLTSDKQFVVMP